MMRSVLRATIFTLGLTGAVAVPAAVAHADGEYLRVTPSTIQAGYQVEIDAFCGDTVNPARVESEAFGVVTITPTTDPRSGKTSHRGTATIPNDKKARAYAVKLFCPSQQTATTTLHVVGFNLRSRGPHTGGGALAGRDTGGDNGSTMIGLGSAVAGAGVLLLFLARRRRASV